MLAEMTNLTMKNFSNRPNRNRLAKVINSLGLVPVDGHLYRRLSVRVMSDTFYDFEGVARTIDNWRNLEGIYHYYSY